MNEEFIARVVVAAGKTMDEFNREVEEIQSQGSGPKSEIEAVKQQLAETSALLMDFMEFVTEGGN